MNDFYVLRHFLFWAIKAFKLTILSFRWILALSVFELTAPIFIYLGVFCHALKRS